MDYGAVLRRAWEIGWRNKALWLLGILASCSPSGRGGGGGQISSGFRGHDFPAPDLQNGVPQDFQGFERFFDQSGQVVIPIVLGLICVVIALSLFFLALGVIGQGGLIAGYSKADEGAKVTLGEAFNAGLEHFWRLLAIRIIFWLAGIILGLVIVFMLLGIGIFTLGIGLICVIPLLCLLIPLALAVDAYVMLTMVAAVEEELPVMESFGRSWAVLKDNLGPVIAIGLILIIGGTIVGVILFLPFVGVVLPAITGAAVGTDLAIGGGIALTVLCLAAGIPVAIAINGVITAFTTGTWTVTYRRITGKAGAELAA